MKSITRNLGITTNSVSVDYDSIGQIKSWTAKELDNTPRLNEQLGFGYDPANNLHLRTNGAMVQTFDNDSLNQLYHIGRSGPLTLSGNTPAPATGVTVNGSPAERYADLTFAAPGQSLLDGNNVFTVIPGMGRQRVRWRSRSGRLRRRSVGSPGPISSRAWCVCRARNPVWDARDVRPCPRPRWR